MKNGIDVSSHQGVINWEEVTTDFVMIRAGWSGYCGGLNQDARFLENVAGAGKMNIPWGVYLYAYDKSPDAAAVSANKLADFLSKYKIPYPVAYDFEDTQYTSMGKADNTAICKKFLETLQSRGFYATLYTYTNFAKGFLNMSELAAYDLWIADYSGKVGWTGPYGMWQHSGSGTAAGITVAVDLDCAYKDYPSIIRSAGLNGYGKTAAGPDRAGLQEENQALRQQVERQTAQLETAQKKLEDIRTIVEE